MTCQLSAKAGSFSGNRGDFRRVPDVVGATTPNRWLLILHIVTVTLGAILFVGHLLILARRAETEFSRKAAQATATVLLISLLFPVGARLSPTLSTQPGLSCEKPVLSADQYV